MLVAHAMTVEKAGIDGETPASISTSRAMLLQVRLGTTVPQTAKSGAPPRSWLTMWRTTGKESSMASSRLSGPSTLAKGVLTPAASQTSGRTFARSVIIYLHQACGTGSALDELLAAVDIEGRAGDRRVGHEMNGQCGNVRRTDDSPDRQRLAEVLTASAQLLAEDRRRKRSVHESRRDEVHADGRELKCEALRQGGPSGREGRDQREARCGAAGTSATHEKQGPSRSNLAHCVAG